MKKSVLFMLLVILMLTSINGLFGKAEHPLKFNHNNYFMGIGSSDFFPDNPTEAVVPLGVHSYYNVTGHNLIIGGNFSADLVVPPGGIGEPTYDYPCPHSNYYILGEQLEGVALTLGFELGTIFKVSDDFEIMPTIGVGFSTYLIYSILVAKSRATGWTYNQGYGDDFPLLFAGDYLLNVVFMFNGISISTGYSRLRGILFGLGIDMSV